MSEEKRKMLAGELYHASDPLLAKERLQIRRLLRKFNDSDPGQLQARQQIMKELIPAHGKNFWIEPPFYCDYGYNIIAGEDVYLNFNCVILDVMKVTIGRNVMLGPSVQLYTATHPMNWEERAAGAEFAKPIFIGSHVWIGGGAIVCPGVTIGDKSVIGAGSVVTKNIPENVFAAGNPCRVLKIL